MEITESMKSIVRRAFDSDPEATLKDLRGASRESMAIGWSLLGSELERAKAMRRIPPGVTKVRVRSRDGGR